MRLISPKKRLTTIKTSSKIVAILIIIGFTPPPRRRRDATARGFFGAVDRVFRACRRSDRRARVVAIRPRRAKARRPRRFRIRASRAARRRRGRAIAAPSRFRRRAFFAALRCLDRQPRRRQAPGLFCRDAVLLADGRALAALRGWVAAAPDRAPPVVAPPPAGTLRIEGTLVADDARAFELRPDRAADSVWQNLNIDRFAQRAGLDFLPFALVWDSPPRLRAIDYRARF